VRRRSGSEAISVRRRSGLGQEKDTITQHACEPGQALLRRLGRRPMEGWKPAEHQSTHAASLASEARRLHLAWDFAAAPQVTRRQRSPFTPSPSHTLPWFQARQVSLPSSIVLPPSSSAPSRLLDFNIKTSTPPAYTILSDRLLFHPLFPRP
jgi:hypothetical protein